MVQSYDVIVLGSGSAGTGKVVFAAGSNTTIYPQWWGAVPTTSEPIAAVMTANTAAIQASFDALSNYTSWTLPPGQYYCNGTLVYGSSTVGAYNYGLTMDFKGKLWFSGCGGLDLNNLNFSNVKGITVCRTARAWDIGTAPDATDFGVRLSQTRRCNISIDDVQNFTYGVYLNGNYDDEHIGMTNAMITFNLGNFQENRYGIYGFSTGTGWNTEMQFFGGHFWSNIKSIIDHSGIDPVTNTLTHPTKWKSDFVTGYAVFYTGAGASAQDLAPAPLVVGGTYYIIRDSDTVIRLAATHADAIADPPVAIDITSTGNYDKNIFGKAGSTAGPPLFTLTHPVLVIPLTTCGSMGQPLRSNNLECPWAVTIWAGRCC